jgi:hypothetical protein
MTTISELQQWLEGAEEQFGDPSAAICQLFFRWSASSLLDHRDDLLVFGMLNGVTHLLFADWCCLAFPLLTDTVKLDAYCARRITKGIYSVMPSLNLPGSLHAFITLYDVPDPAPWERRIIMPGESEIPRGILHAG